MHVHIENSTVHIMVCAHAQRRYVQCITLHMRACMYVICIHVELDETSLFVGNTVALREQLLVLRQSRGQSSPCGI
jgi:hypothetical protein